MSTVGRACVPATDQRAEPGEQLIERERLREVVVRARLEAADPILDGVPGREHQYG